MAMLIECVAFWRLALNSYKNIYYQRKGEQNYVRESNRNCSRRTWSRSW